MKRGLPGSVRDGITRKDNYPAGDSFSLLKNIYKEMKITQLQRLSFGVMWVVTRCWLQGSHGQWGKGRGELPERRTL